MNHYRPKHSPKTFAYEDSNDFDDILISVVGSELGRYQLFVICILCIPTCVLSAFATFDLIFIAYTPAFRCDRVSTNGHSSAFLVDNKNRCFYRQSPSNDSQRCTRFQYDKRYFDQSIVTEWNLVCDKALTVKTIISSLNIAYLIAVVIFPYVQDRWGRKSAFLINLGFYLSGSIGSLLAADPLAFGVCKFVSGVNCLWRIGFVWALEFVGPTKRTTVNTVLGVVFGSSTMLLALIAYPTRRWRTFGAWTSLPFTLLFLISPLLPESPRWLMSQSRLDETAAILQRMARWENRGPPLDLNKLQHQLQRLKLVTDKSTDPATSQNLLSEFFRSNNLRHKILALTIIVAVSNQLYYALVYNAENLHSNFYVAFLLQAGVEPPAVLLNLWLLNRFGRILPLAVTLLLSAACCLLVWPLANFVNVAVLTSAGRFFVCSSVAISEQLGSELYPTVGRGVGASVSYAAMSLAQCAVQYLMYSATVWPYLPLIVMGSLTSAAGLVALMLPETKNRPLPDTVQQAESLGDVGWATFKQNVTGNVYDSNFSGSFMQSPSSTKLV